MNLDGMRGYVTGTLVSLMSFVGGCGPKEIDLKRQRANCYIVLEEHYLREARTAAEKGNERAVRGALNRVNYLKLEREHNGNPGEFLRYFADLAARDWRFNNALAEFTEETTGKGLEEGTDEETLLGQLQKIEGAIQAISEKGK